MKKHALILVGLLCLTSIVCAQISPNYDLSWNVIGGGGGPLSSATYAMRSTVGQIIGLSESSSYNLGTGYWYGIEVQPSQLCGDANGDGNVDFLGDVIGVARHYMYGDPINCAWCADVDCDGDIDFLGDAIKIARHYMYGEALSCCLS
jgi:hypothetical protein